MDALMDKSVKDQVTHWMHNTLIDTDKIASHFGITGKAKERMRAYALRVRAEKYGDSSGQNEVG